MAILAILFLLIIGERLQQKYDYQAYHWEEAFFGEETYAELQIVPDFEDRTAVQPVLDFADEAFSYLGDGDKYELFGKLGEYCYNDRKGVVSENHVIDLLTVKLDGGKGYLWVRYYHEGYDETGERATGAWEIKSRWELEKINGEWVVANILEHP
ncbi:MAG: hypothetical protein NC395_10615 [Prevotella sp.]|nr:hypothetical protein [Prevotella sp.]